MAELSAERFRDRGTMSGMEKRIDIPRERLEQLVREAYKAVAACRTVEDLRGVWVEYYQVLGHRVLARMLLGWTPQDIIRKRWHGEGSGKKEEDAGDV